MTIVYGASPETWVYWDIVLGLGPDLLPVVCQPGLPIAPSSKLVAYGKVPSRVTEKGVVGFPKWTSHITTDEEIAAWSLDSGIGICLQTRHVRAIDVDVEDFDAAQTVREYLDSWALEKHIRFSYRTRRNSCKFLCLFALEGEYGKQVLYTEHGAIELLMNGQQCIVAGMHPSGAMYEWEGGLTQVQIPILTPKLFEYLKNMLAYCLLHKPYGEGWTEGRAPKDREAGALKSAIDPVVTYLLDTRLDLVRSQSPTQLDVICPWSSEHTSQTDASSTSYFPAGTGGFETGRFHCLHAHCGGRTIAEFCEKIGFSAYGFENISDVTDPPLAGFVEEEDFVGDLGINSPRVPSPVDGPRYDRDLKKGKIKPYINNLLLWLRWMFEQGQGVSFDVFRDEYMLDTPTGRRDFIEQDYTRLQSQAELGPCGFAPLSRQLVRDAVRLAALEHCYDSAQEWLAQLPAWDEVERINHFAHIYFGARLDAHSIAVSRYLWTAMPGRILHPGIQADMTLILVSKQGTRKSSAIRAMAPLPEYFTEVSFADGEADLARLTKGKTLVEIPELKGLRSREIEWIKAFVTKRENSWVPKYFEMKTVYARRFLMIGTTNEQEFLADPTGERRWLPLTVGSIDDAAITYDHAQLWAEGLRLYRGNGILWEEAQTSATEYYQDYTIHDAIIDKINDWLFSADSITKEIPATRPFLRLLDVCKEIWPGSNSPPSRGDQMRVTDALSRIGYTRSTKWIDGRAQKVWIRNLTQQSGKSYSDGNV